MQARLEQSPEAKRGEDATQDQDAPVMFKSLQKASETETPKTNSKNRDHGGLPNMVTTRVAKEALRVLHGEEEAIVEEAIAKSPN
mmetsp:Transcript_41518/g.118743  ORF Transcript_41518/g.118743 Transcript_41518/m.118743 type:complete len:85 (-) Transcript_41518:1028-1282(-)